MTDCETDADRDRRNDENDARAAIIGDLATAHVHEAPVKYTYDIEAMGRILGSPLTDYDIESVENARKHFEKTGYRP